MSHAEIVVKVADMAVGTAGDVLVTVGLGSCVAIVLHDPVARVGGLAHILLPSRSLTRHQGNPAKAPETAVPHLVEKLVALGAGRLRLGARLVGGASMFAQLLPAGSIQMGERNIIASRLALRQAGIPVRAEAVGGDYGRTVRFHVAEGRVEVSTVGHGVRSL